MKVIKVEEKYSFFIIIITVIIIIGVVLAGLYIFFDESSSARIKTRVIELFFAIFISLPMLFTALFNKSEYLNKILIDNEFLIFVYKKGKKISKQEKILKENIKKFNLSARLSVKGSYKSRYSVCESNIYIKLNNNKEIVFYVNPNNIFKSSFDFLYDILRESSNIPNFSFSMKGEESLKERVNYFIIHNKKMPFWMQFKKMSFVTKFILGICVLCFLSLISVNLFFLIPSFGLNDNEKAFLSHYLSAQKLRIDNNNYNAALGELDKASTYVNNDVDLYLEKAYNYENLKQYDKAIEEARKGLEYKNKQSINYRSKNIKFSSKDIALYTVIGDCSLKKGYYKEAYQSFDYIIKKVRYKYTDAYFKRGIALFHLKKYDSALEDFIIHKDIINNYLKEQKTSQYKDKYPVYNEKNLNNIDLWIDSSIKAKN